MKYINQLNDNEILELLKPFIWGELKEINWIKRYDHNIEALITSKYNDDESTSGEITLSDRFTIDDYNVFTWDYQLNEEAKLIKNYRTKLLDKFGKQYAFDYLLQ